MEELETKEFEIGGVDYPREETVVRVTPGMRIARGLIYANLWGAPFYVGVAAYAISVFSGANLSPDWSAYRTMGYIAHGAFITGALAGLCSPGRKPFPVWLAILGSIPCAFMVGGFISGLMMTQNIGPAASFVGLGVSTAYIVFNAFIAIFLKLRLREM